MCKFLIINKFCLKYTLVFMRHEVQNQLTITAFLECHSSFVLCPQTLSGAMERLTDVVRGRGRHLPLMVGKAFTPSHSPFQGKGWAGSSHAQRKDHHWNAVKKEGFPTPGVEPGPPG